MVSISEKDKNAIDELIDRLNYHTHLYDIGKPEISDQQWDLDYFKLVEMEAKYGYINPNSPTIKIQWKPATELKKVKHDHPMLSLAKTKDESKIDSFIGNKECVCLAKMDGLTCSLLYENGKFVRAETRGNGEEGEDITHNAMVIPSIPKIINYKYKLTVDGEIICDYKTFEKFKGEYKNPRNFAAGAIRRLDPKECAEAGLTFIAWDLIRPSFSTFVAKMQHLQSLGFIPVPGGTIVDNNFEWAKEQTLDWCKNEGYPIDGLVIKYNDTKYYNSLGLTAHHPNGGIAYKFYDEEYETQLLDIEWSMSRTGTLTPVAIFNPIDIDGTIVERANLHNLSIMRETLGDYPELNQQIWVTKRNQIIPKIERAMKNDIPHDHILPSGCLPVYCPVCGTKASVKDNDGVLTLICPNSDCKGKLSNRIDHYCDRTKGLDIRGLSKKTIEQLIEWGWVNGIGDIYKLDRYRTEWMAKEGFGAVSVGKILNAIDVSKKGVLLDSFISALGIPLVGRTVAKEIVKYYSTWDDFREAVGGDWTQFYGFGYEISRAINNFDYTEADEIARELTFEIPESQDQDPSSKPAQNMNFVITGKLSRKRDDIKADIEKAGGKVTGSVSSKTNYLVCNDKNSTTGKSADAKKLGIPVITEEELNELLGI